MEDRRLFYVKRFPKDPAAEPPEHRFCFRIAFAHPQGTSRSHFKKSAITKSALERSPDELTRRLSRPNVHHPGARISIPQDIFTVHVRRVPGMRCLKRKSAGRDYHFN